MWTHFIASVRAESAARTVVRIQLPVDDSGLASVWLIGG